MTAPIPLADQIACVRREIDMRGSGYAHRIRNGKMTEAEAEREKARMAAVLGTLEAMAEPIPMVLHCPACATQHVDQPGPDWANPPHRSHLCAACGHFWRPADVATTGVAAIQTKGKADSPASSASAACLANAKALVPNTDMGSAPRDGTILRLLVDYSGEDADHALADTADTAWTIGHNNFDNDGEDAWLFAGWCWSHDHYTQGEGKVVGWLPFHTPVSTSDAAEWDHLLDGLEQAMRRYGQRLSDSGQVHMRSLRALLYHSKATGEQG